MVFDFLALGGQVKSRVVDLCCDRGISFVIVDIVRIFGGTADNWCINMSHCDKCTKNIASF